MSKEFNVTIFDGLVSVNATYYTSPDYYELLGRADVLILQAIVDSTPGAATVTAQYQTSNDAATAQAWVDISGFAPAPAPTSATDVPKSAILRNGTTDPMGSFGRVKITTNAQTGVSVRVIACGRVGL